MKKVSLLAVAAIATAALAAPAIASAAEWTSEGEPLAENAEVSFGGVLLFSGTYGSLGCFTTIDSTLEPGDTGTVDSFSIDFSFCQGGGIIASCVLGGSPLLAPEGLPWTLKAKGTTEIELGKIKIVSKFGKSCLVKELVFEGSVVAFPDSSGAISSIEFNGESGLLTTNGFPNTTSVSGTLGAEPAGVYGIQ